MTDDITVIVLDAPPAVTGTGVIPLDGQSAPIGLVSLPTVDGEALSLSLPPVVIGEGAPVALTDAPTIATDASAGRLFTVTLGGNRTLGVPTNLADGMRLTWRFTQDAAGGRTLTLDPVFNVNSAVTSPVTLSTAPNRVDYLGGIYRQPAGKIDIVAFARGF
jgi:hypothetical protein